MTTKVIPILHPRGKFEVYPDGNEEFRWRIVSVNGDIIGASSEGFSSESYCLTNAKLVLLGITDYFKQKAPLSGIAKKAILPKKIEPTKKPLNLFSEILKK